MHRLLFERFPALGSMPHSELAHGQPTSVEELSGLGKAWDLPNLFVKREDQLNNPQQPRPCTVRGGCKGPKTHERRRGRHPAVASRDRARRLGALERLRRFRDAYRAALERWRKREGPVSFPEGTYKMRDYPGVISDRPPPVSCSAV